MKALFLFLFLVPFFSEGQQKNDCRPLNRFWSISAGVTYPKGETAVGFQASHNRAVFSNSFFAGAGVEIITFQQTRSWYVPVFFNVTYVPLDKAVSPVLVVTPGYSYLVHTGVDGGKRKAATGGFTFYCGGGIMFGNASLTAGYSTYTFNGETHFTKQGPAARLAILL